MRNLNEYPITIEEQLEAIDWAIEEAKRQEGDAIGGTRVATLQSIRDMLTG